MLRYVESCHVSFSKTNSLKTSIAPSYQCTSSLRSVQISKVSQIFCFQNPEDKGKIKRLFEFLLCRKSEQCENKCSSLDAADEKVHWVRSIRVHCYYGI